MLHLLSVSNLGRFAAVIAIAAVLSPSPSYGQAFDCVLLNDDNTNIFDTPNDCFLPENISWCNCARSLFTNPVRAEPSGFNQAVQWIVDQPGVGNHRIEVEAGTLDLSGVSPGDVIGESLINELVPQSVGVPPGTFFRLRSEVIVSSVNGDTADFVIRIKEISPIVTVILTYNPLDASYNAGLNYIGRVTSGGPDGGFVIEYRYPAELVDEGAGMYPAIEPGDAADPGFTVRTVTQFFTQNAVYTMPDADEIDISTTLRRFTENGLDEVLELGADLCQEVVDTEPCKLISETIDVKSSLDENSPPRAHIVMLDPDTAFQLPDPAEITLTCSEARVIFYGGNSDDGDGGLQTLSYEWFVSDGQVDGVSIPEETRTFKNTELTFTLPGEYVIGLRVDDGQAENSSDEVDVGVIVSEGFNVQPTAFIVTSPDPAIVELSGGTASVGLDGTQSSSGFFGEQECDQVLTYLWSEVSSPEPGSLTFDDEAAAITTASFSTDGVYEIELEVNDGQPDDNLHATTVLIEVLPGEGPVFLRADANSDGAANISDPQYTLNFLFLGGPGHPCVAAADSNADGAVNISDPQYTLNYLFLGGPPPPAPFMGCGASADPDDALLGCEETSCAG